MGARVVVLVSVVGLGAGYVIGREVGRHEGLAAAASASASASAPDLGLVAIDRAAGAVSCREREAVLASSSGGLRRFRWGGSVMSGVGVA